MNKIIFYLIIVIHLVFLTGCQSLNHKTKRIEPPEKTNIKLTPYSSLLKEFNQIKKPEPIIPRFVITENDYNFTITDINNASHVLLSPEEYYKINQLINLTKKYKTLVYKYDNLLNKQNEQLIVFKQLIDKESNKSAEYYNLLQTNIALLQNCEDEVSSANTTTVFTAIGLGGIILLLVAL